MKRRIIQIDEEKCNGCGACAKACHEGAIGMVGGKAKLMRDDYCDGLGDCLPACPMDAIHFVEREAAAYNEAAVLAAKAHKAAHTGCPGARMRQMHHEGDAPATAQKRPSQLSQWPCQIKLAPVNAPYFDGCELLIAADCTAYAYASIHEDFMRGKITLIGCPKLDDFCAERCSQRDASSHGGSLLRGTRICGKEGHRRKRQGAFSSRGDDLDRGRNSRGRSLILIRNMLK